MKPAAFLRSDEARRVLERAYKASGMPVSVHHVQGEREGQSLCGSGQCAACAFVSESDAGRAACRGSRLKSARYALELQRPVPFLCHMGFACVAAPALPSTGQALVLTMGPYCPAEAPEMLAADALKGLARLGRGELRFFPTPLTDIPHIASACAPALAEWTAENLDRVWRQAAATTDTEEAPTAEKVRGRPRRLRAKTPDTSPYRGGEIAAALAGGDQSLARKLVKSALAEVDATGGAAVAARRARALAVASASLESAERARLNTTEAWEQFPAFVSQVRQAAADSDLSDACMALLASVLKRRRQTETDSLLAELDRMVMKNLPEPLRLNEVAEHLGRHPTAITHHLQRKFGVTFTQYIGRLRMDKAKELLRRTRLSITEVAGRVGVNDQSNFSKMFRKFEGLSPQQYRDQYRTKS